LQLKKQLPVSTSYPAQETRDTPAERAFGFALVFSGIRCILQYAILPFALPILGIAGDVAVQISVVINVIAMISILYSVRRVWRINYRYKRVYLAVGATAFVILCAFLFLDLRAL
jgi:uncharacterized membrane protein YozB (DUF420 family)